MSPGKKGSGAIAMGGLTPLLDTLFLLLFALLAVRDSRSTDVSEEVLVRLPAVEQADASESTGARRITIMVDADSSVELLDSGTKVATPRELDGALATMLGDDLPEEIAVEIRADRDAKHGVAVELLQQLRLRGFVDVLLVASGGTDPDRSFGGAAE